MRQGGRRHRANTAWASARGGVSAARTAVPGCRIRQQSFKSLAIACILMRPARRPDASGAGEAWSTGISMKSPRRLFGSAGKIAAGYLILLALAVAGQSLTHVYRSDLNWADE